MEVMEVMEDEACAYERRRQGQANPHVKVKVRPAVSRNSASIAMVQRRSRSIAYRNFLPPEWMEFSPEEIQRHVARWHQTLVREDDPAPHTWVAEVDGRIVGFISIGPSTDTDDEAQTYSVSALYVDPTHWRRGVGRALLRTAIDTVIVRGCAR